MPKQKEIVAIFSSAKFYLTNVKGIYDVLNYLNLENIDLTKPSRG